MLLRFATAFYFYFVSFLSRKPTLYIMNAKRTDAMIPGKISVDAPIVGTNTRIRSIKRIGAKDSFQCATK